MSEVGIRATHLRTMAALETVIKENQDMKAELDRLRGGGAATLSSSEQLQALRTENERLQRDSARAAAEAEQHARQLSEDLNKEMLSADEERR